MFTGDAQPAQAQSTCQPDKGDDGCYRNPAIAVPARSFFVAIFRREDDR